VLLETGTQGSGPDKHQIEIAKRLRDEGQALRRPAAARAGRTRDSYQRRSRPRRKSAG
jgi:hypothetical protein